MEEGSGKLGIPESLNHWGRWTHRLMDGVFAFRKTKSYPWTVIFHEELFRLHATSCFLRCDSTYPYLRSTTVAVCTLPTVSYPIH